MGQFVPQERSFMASLPIGIRTPRKETINADLAGCQSATLSESPNASAYPQPTLQSSECQPIAADRSVRAYANFSGANFEVAPMNGTSFEAGPFPACCSAVAVQPAGFVANAMSCEGGGQVCYMVIGIDAGMQHSMSPTMVPMHSDMQFAVQPPKRPPGWFSSSSPTRCSTGFDSNEEDTHSGPQVGENREHLSDSAKRRRRRKVQKEIRKAEACNSASVSDEAHFQQGKTTVPEATSTSLLAEVATRSVEWFTNLQSKLEAGGSDRAAALCELRGSVRRFTFHKDACRVVQKAFEVASGREASELVGELHGHVWRGKACPHGNHVFQKIIDVLPNSMSDFIIDELRGRVAEVSRHRFGCRIICRLLEHLDSSPLRTGLVNEILEDVVKLSCHSFGHYVIESLLEHGSCEQKHRLANAIYKEKALIENEPSGIFVLKALSETDLSQAVVF